MAITTTSTDAAITAREQFPSYRTRDGRGQGQTITKKNAAATS